MYLKWLLESVKNLNELRSIKYLTSIDIKIKKILYV